MAVGGGEDALARHTCFWEPFRSATTASRRRRSAELTQMVIPCRMAQGTASSGGLECYECVRPLGLAV